MFFAARTFAMKFGQSVAMVLFTSLAIIGAEKIEYDEFGNKLNDITASKLGLMIAAIVAVTFCVLGAVLLLFYREKKIMKTIAKEGDEAFMKAIENEKEVGDSSGEEPQQEVQE